MSTGDDHQKPYQPRQRPLDLAAENIKTGQNLLRGARMEPSVPESVRHSGLLNALLEGVRGFLSIFGR